MHTELWLLPTEAGGDANAAAEDRGAWRGGAGQTQRVGPWHEAVPARGGNATVGAPAVRVLDGEGRARLGFAAGRGTLGPEQYEARLQRARNAAVRTSVGAADETSEPME